MYTYDLFSMDGTFFIAKRPSISLIWIANALIIYFIRRPFTRRMDLFTWVSIYIPNSQGKLDAGLLSQTLTEVCIAALRHASRASSANSWSSPTDTATRG